MENPDQMQERLHAIRDYVLSGIPSHVPSVTDIAEAFAVSPRQLSRQLKQSTGMTPGRFIREVQLEFARKLLEGETAISVKEVCYDAGFEQPSTFSTLFKKRYGVAPSTYLN